MNIFNVDIALFDPAREGTFKRVLNISKTLRCYNGPQLRPEWEQLYLTEKKDRHIWSKLTFDHMWMQISSAETLDGYFRFPALRALICVVCSIPNSNATVERAFSMITDLKTKLRNRIGTNPINSYCVFKTALKARGENAKDMIIGHNCSDTWQQERLYADIDANEAQRGKMTLLPV